MRSRLAPCGLCVSGFALLYGGLFLVPALLVLADPLLAVSETERSEGGGAPVFTGPPRRTCCPEVVLVLLTAGAGRRRCRPGWAGRRPGACSGRCGAIAGVRAGDFRHQPESASADLNGRDDEFADSATP